MPEQDVPKSDDPLDQGAEVVMPPDSGANDAPSESAAAPVSAHLLVRMLPWRWTRGPSACLPLAQSPERMMISSMRMRQLKWRQAWPTSQSHPPSGHVGEGEGTSIAEAPPPLEGEEV